MQNNFNALIVSVLLMMGMTFMMPSFTSAQQNVPPNGNFNQAPGGTDTTGGQPGAVTTDDGISWLWLLPLLALPLIYLWMRGKRERETDTYRDQGFAGTKGGRSKRRQEDEDDML